MIVDHTHRVNVDSLTRAFIRGAALAVTLSACGETTAGTQPMSDGGLGGMGGVGGIGGTLPPPKLDPIPVRSYPYCVGPDYGEGPYQDLFGQCCGDIRCTETIAGTCPDASSYDLDHIKPPGSGECGCETDEGPFARPDMPDLAPGECCYVIYEIGCTGRPLKQDGVVVTADVVARADWMGAAELPVWS
jgi:hypothetical protein